MHSALCSLPCTCHPVHSRPTEIHRRNNDKSCGALRKHSLFCRELSTVFFTVWVMPKKSGQWQGEPLFLDSYQIPPLRQKQPLQIKKINIGNIATSQLPATHLGWPHGCLENHNFQHYTIQMKRGISQNLSPSAATSSVSVDSSSTKHFFCST